MGEDLFDLKMKALLGDDYKKFADCYSDQPFKGLRVNTLKACEKTIEKYFGKLDKTPFCSDGYYLPSDIKGIGNHPLHHAGAFYVQEPSAMSAVSILDVTQGDRVLDLCAAPGGKSTQIASALGGKGVLVANEYVLQRARILDSNLERMGVKNAVVTSERPDRLCEKLQGYFDKVLVDAPCSGEGMFRKEPSARKEWSEQAVLDCAKRQAKILDSAKDAVREGGELVYSTCTFSLEENERQIDEFLKRNPDFELVDCGVNFGSVIPKSRIGITADSEKMRRIFPFDGGEGHFAAKLKRISGGGYSGDFETAGQKSDLFSDFWSKTFAGEISEKLFAKDGKIYILPDVMPDITGLNVLRAGVFAGREVKNRFEPEHCLFMASKYGDVLKRLELESDDRSAADFLHGMELSCDKTLSGFVGVFVDGISVGFGKASGGKLKNRYPKGLRTL